MNKIKRIVEHILRINDITIENDNRRKVYEVPEGTLYTQTRIADVYGNARAIVTVVSDDGFYSSGVNLDNIFGKRNLKCTVAGTVRIVKPLKKKWSKLLENENIEIINHSYRHLEMKDGTKIATNKAVLTHEIRDAGRWLEKWLKNKQIAFACPCNELCELGYEILEHNNYYAVRRGARGWNSLSPQVGREKGQWFNLRIKGIVDNEADTLIRNEWVDVAIENKKWLIEMWHNVMEEDDGLFQTILKPKNIWIIWLKNLKTILFGWQHIRRQLSILEKNKILKFIHTLIKC